MKYLEQFDTDLLEESHTLTLMQYREAPRFQAWMGALIKPLEDFKRILIHHERVFSIDHAEGVWLDRIGDLVGVKRRFCVMRLTTPATYKFAFDDSTFTKRRGWWGDDNTVPGWWDDYPLMVEDDIYSKICSDLDDVKYRKLIKAKIASSHSKATTEDAITSIKNIFGHDRFYFCEMPYGESKTLGLVVADSITQFDADLFLYSSVAPKPAGVRYAVFHSLPLQKVFCFDDTNFTPFVHGFWDDDTIPANWIF